MLSRLFSWVSVGRFAVVCFAVGVTASSVTPAFGQHGGGHSGGHGGGHSGGSHGGGMHSGGSHISGSHSGGSYSGGPHSGISHHSSGHINHGYGGYGGGYGIGMGGYSGFGGGYSGFGVNSGFGGYGSNYGYGGSRLGYSSLGYTDLGYSGYSSYLPTVYYAPTYSHSYIVPRYVTPYSQNNAVVVIPSASMKARNSNVYSGPISADGQPTGDLRPGMILPDGAVVVSVGAAAK